MNICLLSDGKSIHTMRWVKSLLEHNHNVSLISLNESLYTQKNISFHKISFGFGKLDYILSVPFVNKIIKQVNPDLIHVHYLTGYGSIAANITIDRPIILSPWGSDVFVTLRGKGLYSKILRNLIRPALTKASFITTETKSMADILKKEFQVNEDKLKVIPWGIDLSIFNPISREEKSDLKRKLGIPENSLIVTSIRNMKEFYRIHEIVKAFSKVLKLNKDIFLILITGYYDLVYLEEIKKLVFDLNLSNNILIIEELLNSQNFANLLCISDIIISIPISDNLPKSVIEGMACGAIPIVSISYGTKELVEDSKFKLILTIANVEDLAQKLKDVICNFENIKNEFVTWNFDLIKKNYSWEISYLKMEELYKLSIKEFRP